MPSDAHAQTAILYEHPLLAEGIAAYLRVAVGTPVALAAVSDENAVRCTLALDPDVVIFERAGVLRGQDLAALAPHAVIIDVTSAVCLGTPVDDAPVDLDRIVAAVVARLDGVSRHAGPRH